MKCVVLAYHNIGRAGIEALRKNGFEISAVFTHQDNPDENIWFGSVAELAGEYDKIYDPATGEYGVDVVEIPGSAILASALKEDSTVENLGEIAGETYGNLSYLSVADWMPADLLHK